MMQSILLTSPNKTTTADANSETKVGENSTSVEGKEGEENSSLRFSAVLDNLIASDEAVNEEAIASDESDLLSNSASEDLDANLDVLIGEEEAVELELDNLLTQEEQSLNQLESENEADKVEHIDKDKNILAKGNNAATESDLLKENDAATDGDLLKENDVTTDSDLVKGNDAVKDIDIVKNSDSKKNDDETKESDLIKNNDANKSIDEVEVRNTSMEPKEVLNSEKTLATEHANEKTMQSETQKQAGNINPLLDKIENAQKVDTKVTEIKQTLSPQETDVPFKDVKKEVNAIPLAFNQNNKTKFDNSDKATFENALADESDSGDELGKELLAKDNLRLSEKFDALIPALKTEAPKTLFSNNIEQNNLPLIGGAGTSVSERLLSQTINNSNSPVMQSALLQQPLELQSKQASAIMGERIMMMINQGKQEVTIRLDPAELGSMHIKLQVQQDQLQVVIQTQLGQSRDIIEQNLPRLREQLAQQGINLGEANVEQQSQQQHSNSNESTQTNIATQRSRDAEESVLDDQSEWMPSQIPLPAQGIDYYA